jgi:hypothetical protein
MNKEMNQKKTNNQKKVILEFYIPSTKSILIGDEKQAIGYVKCEIYNTFKLWKGMQGCAGNIMIILLDNERIIKTNDLWICYETWTKELPTKFLSDEIIMGEIISDWTKYQEYIKMTDGVKSYIY